MLEFWTTIVRNSLTWGAVRWSGVTDRRTVKTSLEGGRWKAEVERTYLRVRRPSEGTNGHCMRGVGDG